MSPYAGEAASSAERRGWARVSTDVVRRIRAWQAAGYRVSVIYLRLSSADQTVERVAKRVSEGGHDIPESVARRRFERSWGNFCDLYREIADDWRVYDNSGDVPVLLAQSRGWQEVREPS